jgi:hypothetical protein
MYLNLNSLFATKVYNNGQVAITAQGFIPYAVKLQRIIIDTKHYLSAVLKS